MNTICFLLLTFYGVCTVLSNTAIPSVLRECYTKRILWGSQLPMNLRVIIDIIQKVERYSYSSMNIRTISTSLLRRFKFDGVGFDEKVLPMNGILPFTADQPQRAKQEIVEELIPGNPHSFPSDALTLLERCTLHQAISNTIWYHQLENEDNFCIPSPIEKLIGKASIKERKICPKENGVIQTRFGTIALGNVINAIAASLEPQKVELNVLFSLNSQKYSDFPSENGIKNFGYNEEEVDLIIPKDKMTLQRSMWIKSLSSTSTKLDNVWVSTLAGELAEMVVYQGPIVRSEMSIGATGFWNSTMRPAIFYISNRRGFFDATRAEIIGSIDGIVIAKSLPEWFKNFQSFRLSQVLEMYYSDRGFAFNNKIKACDRGTNFIHIAPGTILEEQTQAVSKILAFRNGNVFMTDEAIQRLVNHATNTFTYYVNNHVFTELNCRRENPHPRVEIFVTFDGAWTKDYTTDFLSVLIEDVDVSIFGSKMGLIHGSSGKWLFNLTNSPASIYEDFKNFNKIPWPISFNYSAVLKSVFEYLETAWKENEDKCKIGNIGQAVVLLTPRARLSEKEEQSALNLIHEIKIKHPEIYFLYFISESNIDVFKKFLISDEDRLIRSSYVGDISRLLLEVPVNLRPIYCKINTRGVKEQIEDYITPEESIIYKLHSQWRSNTKKMTLTVHGVGYGTMEICTWTKWKINEAQKDFYCQPMAEFGDIQFQDFAICSKKKKCPSLYYQIHKVTALTKCAEMDCKLPNQVRYIIRIKTTYHSHSQKILPQYNLLISTLLFYLSINSFIFLGIE